ncbi:hypothetical protein G6F65_016335 [Rhizopus arrhizus]|nr:hypothetical protein G6F65_016335 [Rhizopus arrhizus]
MTVARSSGTKSGLPAAGMWYIAATSGVPPLAVRLGQLAQRFLDVRQRGLRVELAGHDQHGVIRLVVLVIESAQLSDVHVFHVGSGADGVLAIAVPMEGCGLHLLHQDAGGAVFPAFHFVADHGHFRIQVFLGDQGIDHGVGLPAQVPLEGLGVGGEAGEIVGAVAGGRAVGLQAAARKLAHGVAGGGRALEQHMFKQVRHAGLAVVLVARADQIGHVDRGRGLGFVGDQQHSQAIGQAVFGDAFNRGGLRDAGRKAGGAGLEGQKGGKQQHTQRARQLR